MGANSTPWDDTPLQYAAMESAQLQRVGAHWNDERDTNAWPLAPSLPGAGP